MGKGCHAKKAQRQINLRYCELSGVNRLIGHALQWTNLLVRTSPPLCTCAGGLGVG